MDREGLFVMSIDKHLEARGVQLADDNTLPKEQRTQKVMKRVIAAVRAAESEFNDELRDANERCRIAQAEVIELQRRLQHVETELRKSRVKETVSQLDVLSIADQRKLIECA
jgi:phytoene/squalene synthetase